MNNISSQTLFHFTPKIEFLESILKSGFFPRFCLEKLTFFDIKEENEMIFEYAFPTVCFCDIPFSKAHSHTLNYGRFGIGMKKEWAMHELMKINPVLYYYPHSYTAASQIFRLGLLNDLMKIYPDDKKIAAAYGSTFQYFNFLKPYSGEFWRNGKYSENSVNFYDEREWKFTAAVGYLKKEGIRQFLSKDEFLDIDIIQQNNQLLQDTCALYFKASDVKYIIVEKDSQVPEIVEKLKDFFKNERLDEPIELLYTKVLSLETFEKDI